MSQKNFMYIIKKVYLRRISHILLKSVPQKNFSYYKKYILPV
jgi:hypothetical protein